MVPLNHGLNGAGTYESSAFFIRHDPSSSEFLFFGDVEPDAIARTPRNIDIWRIAAPMIVNGTLGTLFIECSWPSGRPDEQLYGHLSPEHLVTELEVLASEVAKVRENDNLIVTTTTSIPRSHSRSQPARKKRKKTPTPSTRNRNRTPTPTFSTATDQSNPQNLLDGLRVYVMHCKDTMDCAPDKPIGRVIVEEVRALVLQKGLGAEVFGAEQGMRIGEVAFHFVHADPDNFYQRSEH
jgi:3',5'-cyclic-nucleotide phosphodiesterase